MSVAVFERRVDPGQIESVVLAVLVHVLLALLLVLGVQWQNRPPVSVAVEIWTEPVAAAPAPEPKPEPRVEPPPAPKPEPVIVKPEIAVPAPKPKPVPKPVPKAEPKPVPAKPKPPSDAEAQKRLREELAREQAAFAVNRQRDDAKARLAREAAAANLAALKAWEARVGQLIRSRIQNEVAQAVPGNPQAVVRVVLLPSYEVREYAFQTRTGNAAYDEQVESALKYFQKVPLPRPDNPELVEDELRRNRRELILTFRPKER